MPRAPRDLAGLTTAVAVAGLLAGCPAAAWAGHGKVDHVVLKTGDRFTCEIVRLVRGKMTVKTDALGTVSVEWNKVGRVDSPVEYEVEIKSGVRWFGVIASPADGQLTVGTGALMLKTALDDVVELTPIERNFWDRLDGSVSAGFSFTQASDVTQWSLHGDVSQRTRNWLAQATFDSMLTIEKGDDRESRQTLTLSAERFFANRWFGSFLGQFSRNEDLGLVYRAVTGGGVGRVLIDAPTAAFSATGGLSSTREKYVDVEPESRAEFYAGLRWDRFSYGSRDVDVTISAIGFLDLRSGRVRAEVNSAVQREIITNLKWTFTLFESYNSAPPSGEKKNDFGLTAALGWTF
jgi:hypothetical protein